MGKGWLTLTIAGSVRLSLRTYINAAKLQSVNDEVFCPGGNLHQAGALEAPVRVVLKYTERRGNSEKRIFVSLQLN